MKKGVQNQGKRTDKAKAKSGEKKKKRREKLAHRSADGEVPRERRQKIDSIEEKKRYSDNDKLRGW